jgi:thiopeptide-type bacteriocin biosynthesis protein
MNEQTLFTPAPFFLVRKPALSFDDFLCLFDGDGGSFEKLILFYEKTSLLQEAIALASPSLFAMLEKGDRSRPVLYSLLKYFIRMTSRSTPFGLFSSVSLGGWGEKAIAFFDPQKMERRERPDMGWLLETIDAICNHPPFFSSLSIQRNPLVRKIGGRFIIDYFRRSEQKKAVSIKSSLMTEVIFELTQKTTPISTLVEKLLLRIPRLEKEKVECVIKQLIEQQFLWFAISPTLLTTSPLQKLLSQLTDEQRAFFMELQKEQKLQVDAFERGQTVTLPPIVAREVARAAEMLASLSFQEDTYGLNAYHDRFLEKYGTRRIVPLMELLSEEKGLGIPAIYKNPSTPRRESFVEADFQKLLYSEYAKCLQKGSQEIELTDLKLPPSPSKALQLSLELYFEVIADSPEAVEKGEFLLSNTFETWQGGASFGRFLDLFDEAFHEEFKALIQAEEDLAPGVCFVESAYLPPNAHAQNVGIHPAFRKKVIDLTALDKSTCSLEEIFVGSDGKRLVLTTQDGEGEFHVTAGDVLNPSYAPIPIRFLREVSSSKYRQVFSFSWRKLEGMPFLPRIKACKAILSPAEWNVQQKDLDKTSFMAWADLWKMPRYVFLTMADQRLLLDLHRPLALQLIQNELKKGRALKFTEKVGQEKGQWMQSKRGRHAVEFVFPLLRNFQQSPISKKAPYTPFLCNQRWKLPGSEWLFTKFYLPQESEAWFLTQHLRRFADFLQEQKVIQRWFFVRYADERSHIRIRFYGDPHQLVTVLIPYLEDWSADLLQEGLIQEMAIASYEREIERYGGEACLETVERFFCSDSQVAIALLQGQYDLPDYAIGALSILDFIPGTLEERLSFFAARSIGKDDLENFRTWKKPLLSFAEAILSQTLSETSPSLSQALNLRKDTLVQLHRQLKPEDRQSILDSLVHMHCNRLFGVDPKLEGKARAHALHVLSSLQQRQQHGFASC